MTIRSERGYRIRSKTSPCSPLLTGLDLALVGPVVDDRGAATTNSLKAATAAIRTFVFEVKDHRIYLDGIETKMDRLRGDLAGKRRVILDATTLGVGEMLLLLLALTRAGVPSVEFLYAEPLSYTKREANGGHAQQRDYALSTNCKFSTVQGFAQEYDSSRMGAHVFLLGFEPARMLNAIEQRGYEDKHKTTFQAIVGVPAFQSGWEADSIRPHLPALEDLGIRENSISYCQANSIREAYLALWDLYRELGDEQSCFYVSPLGTKPHAVAAALFLLETKAADAPTSLYYDHPYRVPRRSSDVGAWHHVVVDFA